MTNDTLDAELRRLLDQGQAESDRDRTVRLLICLCGFTMAGILLLAALIALVFLS